MNQNFIPGLDLNRHFFQQVVGPLMAKHFPDLQYATGLIGEGSDVLGLDGPQSMDHNWGPHLAMLFHEKDYDEYQPQVDKMLRNELPLTFMGFSTNFTAPDDRTYLMQQMKPVRSHPVNHYIEFYTIKSFTERFIGFNGNRTPRLKDWLAFPQQGLLEVTAGEVYFDTIGLNKVREKFAYYPDDIWEYLYMAQWERIGDEQAFMGRSGESGDEVGSSLIAGHLAQNIMRLCFYMEKRYYPYVKWFGNAFSRLPRAAELTAPLIQMLHGKDWRKREEVLEKIYEIILQAHNDLKLTKPIRIDVTDFFGRPYKVLRADIIVKEIRAVMQNEDLLDIKYPIGSLDQFIAHTHINHINKVYNEFKPLLGKIERTPGGPSRDIKKFSP